MNKQEKERILERAKNTKYKHSMWSLEHSGIDTVHGFMEWAAAGHGMYLDLKPSIRALSDISDVFEAELKKNNVKNTYKRQELIDLCIKYGSYNSLILRSDERGSDRGILKMQTYLILKGLI